MDGIRFNPIAAGNDAANAADPLAQPAPAAPDPAYAAKATEAAVKFESFFIGQMLHKMRESARSVGDRDQQADSVNSDMLDLADNLVADQLAQRHAFGIADSLLRTLLPPPAAPLPAQDSGQATKITKN
jgi:flagellar protein FlgJ